MNRLQELKQIAAKQKTIQTSRLIPILKEIEKMYIDQGFVIRSQTRQLKELRDELNGIKGKRGGKGALCKKGI
jgi:hypothetical protein